MSYIRCVVMLAVVLVTWECGATKGEVGGAGKGGSSDVQVDNPPTAEANDSVIPVTKEPEDVGLENSKVTQEDSHQDHSTEHKSSEVSAAHQKGRAEGEEERRQPGQSSPTVSGQQQLDEAVAAPVETKKPVAPSTGGAIGLPHRESIPESEPTVLNVPREDSTQQSHGEAALRQAAEHQVSSMDTSSHGKSGQKKRDGEEDQHPRKPAPKLDGPTEDRRNSNNEDDRISAQRPIVPDPRHDSSLFAHKQGSQGNAGSHETQAGVAGRMSKSEKPVTALPEVPSNVNNVGEAQRFAKKQSPANPLKEPSIAIGVPPGETNRDTSVPSKSLHASTNSTLDNQHKRVPLTTTKENGDTTTATEKEEELRSPLDPKVTSTAPIPPLHTVSNALPLHHSVDKTDGILGSSSLFALAALATLAVVSAAPAH